MISQQTSSKATARPLHPKDVPALRRGGRAYFVSLMVAQVCALLRYAALARILGPEQLGLAAVIVLTGQFFDSLTDAGSDRFLIQDQHGYGTAAFKLVELVAGSRGLVMAALITLLAKPVAVFAGAPETAEALRIFAIIPLISGFTNYDFRAAQRKHDFLPEALVMAASEFAGLIATVTAGLLIRDFTAILYGLGVRAVVSVAVSHFVAKRRYAVGFDEALARRLWRFGAPLMLNGLLLFVATQSDRIIISRALGVTELGRYSVTLLPVLYPAATMMKYLATLYLPQLTGAQGDPAAFALVARNLSRLCFALAAALTVGFAFLAPPVLPVVFGKNFVQSSVVVALVGILMAFRLIKVAPTTVAMAMGATTIPPFNNILRLLGVGFAIVGVQTLGGLPGVVLGLIAGELIANFAATVLVNRRANWPLTQDVRGYALFTLLSGVVLVRGAAADGASIWIVVVCSILSLLMVFPYARVVLRLLRKDQPVTADHVRQLDGVTLESANQ